jgi:hypothetical protein
MAANYFVLPDESYQRNIEPIEAYMDQMSNYIHLKTKKPIQECREILKNYIQTNKNNKVRNPIVKYLERQENGDRYSKQIRLSDYIKEVIKNKEILAPTMTSYVSSDVKQSIHSLFIGENVKIRAIAKKEAFMAQARGDTELYISKNNEQGIKKIYNNSLSGAFGSTGTSLFNLTAHSTLTSTTRAVSSLGNAINEKLISGNRHYKDYYSVLNNILSIIQISNLEEIQSAVHRFNLKYPTTEQVMQCIEYSTKLYWNNPFYLDQIKDFVDTLSPVQKAAFVYTGDLYHIRELNSDFVYDFLTRLKEKKTISLSNSIDFIKNSDENVVNFASIICSEEVKGLGKEYDKMPQTTVDYICGTVKNINETLDYYQQFIRVFFASPCVPASVAYIPSMVRRAVVLSDTDSTMFSTDEYIQWYYKKMYFSTESFSLAASVSFITTQSIANGLKILSANINVNRNKLSILSMKPEYSFPVFVQTSVAKHYFAMMAVQEGNVFEKPKYEIKGVHLKSSAAPAAITQLSKEWMQSILDDVYNNKKLSIKSKMTELANLERKIYDSIQSGKTEYFRSGKIKNFEAYAGALGITPYFHHLLWTEVFENKYGTVENVPYDVIKIPLNMPNKTASLKWIMEMKDREVADRLQNTLTKYNKEKLGTILLNKGYCNSQGIPVEIIEVIDIKRIVLELTKSFRMIVETLGVCIKKDMLAMELGY